jgi:hypothetical protein
MVNAMVTVTATKITKEMATATAMAPATATAMETLMVEATAMETGLHKLADGECKRNSNNDSEPLLSFLPLPSQSNL